MAIERDLVLLTMLGWGVAEIGLILRDSVRGTGSTARDRGTRGLSVAAWSLAFAVSWVVTAHLRPGPPWQLGHWHLLAGLIVMWTGLVIRGWAIAVLGPAFRTTVEVGADQAVVDHGPYRFVRHPSYTGMLLISVGAGLIFGNWLSLAVFALLPLAAMLRRIVVEEATLADVMGEPYLAYQQRTKRLVPGLW